MRIIRGGDVRTVEDAVTKGILPSVVLEAILTASSEAQESARLTELDVLML